MVTSRVTQRNNALRGLNENELIQLTRRRAELEVKVFNIVVYI